MVQLSAVEGSRSVGYLAIRAVMTVDRAALSTLRALHEKGKSGYGSISPRNSTFFFANWVRLVSILGEEFYSLPNKSMSSKKLPPSKRMQTSPG